MAIYQVINTPQGEKAHEAQIIADETIVFRCPVDHVQEGLDALGEAWPLFGSGGLPSA